MDPDQLIDTALSGPRALEDEALLAALRGRVGTARAGAS
jgi:hypothetical protein